MPGRSERSNSDASSTQSFSEDQVRGFSAENDDNSNNDDRNERPGSSRGGGRSGLVAVQASERLMLPSHRRGDTSDAPMTARSYAAGLATVRASERLLLPSRRHKGDDRVRSFSNSSGESLVDHTEKLEEGGIRYIPHYHDQVPFLCNVAPTVRGTAFFEKGNVLQR